MTSLDVIFIMTNTIAMIASDVDVVVEFPMTPEDDLRSSRVAR